MAIEDASAAKLRWDSLWLLQEHYSEFIPFLIDGMYFLGFKTTEVQEDIARFIAYGPDNSMVQAQRSQAKTTIAALYSVWRLIHDPKTRILIFSAGETQASEISTLIVRIICMWDILECLRPDTSAGDRSSVQHFDVHYTLKGIDKSPSVKCLGIKSNMQGARADLLIADDVESYKNSNTQILRAELLHITKDFASIVTHGKILWLGTPQTEMSIYTVLPSRGVTVRIWPGRYPTTKQMEFYGDKLAPMLVRALLRDPSLHTGGGVLGDQGRPIEKDGTGYLDEYALQKKEEQQGIEYFQLQHMLNTKLSDEQKFPLKLNKLILLEFGELVPMTIVPGMEVSKRTTIQRHIDESFNFQLNTPHSVSLETERLSSTIVYVDPAGGGANADETSYMVLGHAGSKLFLIDIGGVRGGYDKEHLIALAKRIAKYKPNTVIIEQNFGHGAFKEVFLPILKLEHPECAVIDDYVTGQKERRIINTLEPIIGRGSLIVHPRCLESDKQDCSKYLAKDRITYSLFYQIANITSDKNALVHDDRVDALEGAARHFQNLLVQDQDAAAKKKREEDYKELLKDPMMKHRNKPPQTGGSIFRRYER